MPNKLDKYKQDLSEIMETYNDSDTPKDVKEALKPSIDKLKDLIEKEKENKDSQPKSKESKTKSVATKKSVTIKKDAVDKSKSALAKCKEIIAKHKEKIASETKRVEKRKKQGKPAELLPSETIKKAADSVKSKVVEMKSNNDKGFKISEENALINAITQSIKNALQGITNNAEKHRFLNKLMDNVKKLHNIIPKVAEDGMMIESVNFGESMDCDTCETFRKNLIQISHHISESMASLRSGVEVEEWIVARSTRAATDMSDIAHHLESELNFKDGGYMAKGGGFDQYGEPYGFDYSEESPYEWHFKEGEKNPYKVWDKIDGEYIAEFGSRKSAIEFIERKNMGFSKGGMMKRGGEIGGFKKGDKVVLKFDINNHHGSEEVLVVVGFDDKKLVLNSTSKKIGKSKNTQMLSYVYPDDVVSYDDFLVSKMANSGYMAKGGETNEGVDLFEDYDNIPQNVQKVLDKHSKAFEYGDYRELEKAHKDLLKIGYTFEYGLDGEAYDLRKLGQKGKSEEYANGGYMAKGGRLLSALNRDRAYTSNEEHEKSYKRVGGKEPRYKHEDGGLLKGKYPNLSDMKPTVINEDSSNNDGMQEIDEVELTLERNFYYLGKKKIESPTDAIGIFHQFFNKNLLNIQEHMSVMLLDQSNNVIGIYQHSKGAINATVADPELIAAVAIKTLAKGVIIAHNHPSGNTTPSQADINLTNNLRDGLKLFGISLLDSLILTKDINVSRSIMGTFESGGSIEHSIDYIISDGSGKYYSRNLGDGTVKWNDSQDMAYMFSKREAESIKSKLELEGYSNLSIEKYDKDWWKKMERGGEFGIDKHRVYFSSFSEVMDAIHDIANDNGYNVVDIFPDLSYGGVGYGDTKRAKVELEWDGEDKKGKSKQREKNTLNVQIYRMDSGNYELNSYFSYASGGMMADGGEVQLTNKDIFEKGKIKFYEFNGKVYPNERYKVIPHIKCKFLVEYKSKMYEVDGGLYENGDIKISTSYQPMPLSKSAFESKFEDNFEGGWQTISKYKPYKSKSELIKSLKNDSLAFEGKMAMGGKVKFADKVKSIKSSLLKRKKVSPSVQKDYGKTYSPKEAEESAKRIVGAMLKKRQMK